MGLKLDLESCQTIQDQYRFILKSIVSVPRSPGPHKIPIVVIRHLLNEAAVANASTAFVFFPSNSNRSGPMRISRTASASAAVFDVHRSSDPGERGDEVLTRGAHVPRMRYLVE